MERFGWTFDQAEALTVEQLHILTQIDDGKAKVRAESAAKQKSERGRR